MEQMKIQKITMITGDKCDTEGLYWSSGCGHAQVKEFTTLETFPYCATCKKSINWIHTNHDVANSLNQKNQTARERAA